MLKKINYIFSLKGIFDFSHSWFDTSEPNLTEMIRMIKEFRAVALVRAQLF